MSKLKDFITERITHSEINGNNIEKINLSEFEIGEKVSKNNVGYTSICKKTKTNKIYSLFVISKAEIMKTKYIDYPLNLYQNLSSIYHPFIIELKGINNTDPYNLFFLFEFLTGAL